MTEDIKDKQEETKKREALAGLSELDKLIAGRGFEYLSDEQRAEWVYRRVISLGLDPLSNPMDWLTTREGKLLPYLKAGATDQLRNINSLSVEPFEEGWINVPDPKERDKMVNSGVYYYKVRVTDPAGRFSVNIGAVTCLGQTGEALANSMMRGLTKANRRATISHLGLGMLDESEAKDIPGASALPTKLTPPERPALPAESQNASNSFQIAPGSTIGAAKVATPSPVPIVAPTASQAPQNQFPKSGQLKPPAKPMMPPIAIGKPLTNPNK